jgi:hypothetical protein
MHVDFTDPDSRAFRIKQGVIKKYRLSWLTNSPLVDEPKCGGSGEGAVSQPMSTAVHMELK